MLIFSWKIFDEMKVRPSYHLSHSIFVSLLTKVIDIFVYTFLYLLRIIESKDIPRYTITSCICIYFIYIIKCYKSYSK